MSAESDLRERMAPSDAQVAAARAALDGRRSVFVALAFPNKDYGWWTWGQPVMHVEGVHLSKNAACLAAARHLGECPGTVGYVRVTDDGWACWEDILTPAKLIDLHARGELPLDEEDW